MLRRIHTSSPEAQALFDQGLLLMYDFNRPEVTGVHMFAACADRAKLLS